jgi:hypothetical protein
MEWVSDDKYRGLKFLLPVEQQFVKPGDRLLEWHVLACQCVPLPKKQHVLTALSEAVLLLNSTSFSSSWCDTYKKVKIVRLVVEHHLLTWLAGPDEDVKRAAFKCVVSGIRIVAGPPRMLLVFRAVKAWLKAEHHLAWAAESNLLYLLRFLDITMQFSELCVDMLPRIMFEWPVSSIACFFREVMQRGGHTSENLCEEFVEKAVEFFADNPTVGTYVFETYWWLLVGGFSADVMRCIVSAMGRFVIRDYSSAWKSRSLWCLTDRHVRVLLEHVAPHNLVQCLAVVYASCQESHDVPRLCFALQPLFCDSGDGVLRTMCLRFAKSNVEHLPPAMVPSVVQCAVSEADSRLGMRVLHKLFAVLHLRWLNVVPSVDDDGVGGWHDLFKGLAGCAWFQDGVRYLFGSRVGIIGECSACISNACKCDSVCVEDKGVCQCSCNQQVRTLGIVLQFADAACLKVLMARQAKDAIATALWQQTDCVQIGVWTMWLRACARWWVSAGVEDEPCLVHAWENVRVLVKDSVNVATHLKPYLDSDLGTVDFERPMMLIAEMVTRKGFTGGMNISEFARLWRLVSVHKGYVVPPQALLLSMQSCRLSSKEGCSECWRWLFAFSQHEGQVGTWPVSIVADYCSHMFVHLDSYCRTAPVDGFVWKRVGAFLKAVQWCFRSHSLCTFPSVAPSVVSFPEWWDCFADRTRCSGKQAHVFVCFLTQLQGVDIGSDGGGSDRFAAFKERVLSDV